METKQDKCQFFRLTQKKKLEGAVCVCVRERESLTFWCFPLLHTTTHTSAFLFCTRVRRQHFSISREITTKNNKGLILKVTSYRYTRFYIRPTGWRAFQKSRPPTSPSLVNQERKKKSRWWSNNFAVYMILTWNDLNVIIGQADR